MLCSIVMTFTKILLVHDSVDYFTITAMEITGEYRKFHYEYLIGHTSVMVRPFRPMSDIFSHTQEQSRVDSGSTSSTSEVHLDLRREFTLKHGVAICMGLMLGISMYVSPTAVIRGTHSGGLALGKSPYG